MLKQYRMCGPYTQICEGREFDPPLGNLFLLHEPLSFTPAYRDSVTHKGCFSFWQNNTPCLTLSLPGGLLAPPSQCTKPHHLLGLFLSTFAIKKNHFSTQILCGKTQCTHFIAFPRPFQKSSATSVAIKH